MAAKYFGINSQNITRSNILRSKQLFTGAETLRLLYNQFLEYYEFSMKSNFWQHFDQIKSID